MRLQLISGQNGMPGISAGLFIGQSPVPINNSIQKIFGFSGFRSLFLFILIMMELSHGMAQNVDSTVQKTEVLNSDISLVMSYYSQDGDHSAVTGGIGTEELTVFAVGASLGHDLDSNGRLLVNAGIDVITSASTDNIDYRVSSASYRDNRIWLSGGYERNFRKKRILAGILPSASMESDYLSFGIRSWINYAGKSSVNRLGFSFQAYFDDLRWGRLNPDYRRPVTVVYPVELRDTAWFDIYMRYSWVFAFDYQHDINRRMTIRIAPGFAFQNGLLSTPFHRVYEEGSEKAVVENLPQQRFKFYVILQLNWFAGKRFIMKPYFRFYVDDFGILAHAFALDMPVKLNARWSVIPFGRFYTQIGSRYFYPYEAAPVSAEYYTSDYDLSAFNSYKIGMGISFLPFAGLGKSRMMFREVSIRYSFFTRTDGLNAHIISSYFDWGIRREKRKD